MRSLMTKIWLSAKPTRWRSGSGSCVVVASGRSFGRPIARPHQAFFLRSLAIAALDGCSSCHWTIGSRVPTGRVIWSAIHASMPMAITFSTFSGIWSGSSTAS